MSTLPANLPDERTAQRLLDILAELESRLPQSAGQSAAGSVAQAAQVSELERQLQTLKRKQSEARTRLQALADKLESTQTVAEVGVEEAA